MKILLRTVPLVILSSLLATTNPAHADYQTWLQNQKDCLKPTFSTFVAIPLIASVVYTFFKPAPETINHEKNFINFIDDVWCGNCQVENGTIQEGNRVKPYVIPARGLIGNAIKYFWPVTTTCAIATAYYLAHAAYNGLTTRGLEEIIMYDLK